MKQKRISKRCWHVLSNIDESRMTANCSRCGPVEIVRSGYRHRCAVTEREGNRRKKLRQRYGVAVDDLDFSKCELCKRQATSEERSFGVDHDHETGKVRGVLCSSCNTALGHARDNPALLRRMARYIERHSK